MFMRRKKLNEVIIRLDSQSRKKEKAFSMP